ncbi:hypothetical protein FH972_000312 [Carpinus fangiana]|uniref:UspA domain-containing protein n=1 Tax=Carpinus fangiana TaxID=176857 RepID=A0A5N6Q8I2_9ROSI|nr:hypothetical protein FH972_000312 [Carpinus fangiana]
MASPKHATAITVQPSSPRFPASGTPTAGAQRKIGIAVDLSDESAFAVKWAVQNYLRPGDARKRLLRAPLRLPRRHRSLPRRQGCRKGCSGGGSGVP